MAERFHFSYEIYASGGNKKVVVFEEDGDISEDLNSKTLTEMTKLAEWI